MFRRLLKPYKSRSFFLFGARGTGKSTFLKEFFKNDKILVFDLLDPPLEDELAKKPNKEILLIEIKSSTQVDERPIRIIKSFDYIFK